MKGSNNVTKSIAHTKWNCKYHIVFAPKYRRKVFFEEKRLEIREILRTLCAWKGVEIIEGEICPDHVHLLLSIPPKYSISILLLFGTYCFNGLWGYKEGVRRGLLETEKAEIEYEEKAKELYIKNGET